MRYALENYKPSMNFVTPCNSAADLIAFGEDHNKAYLKSGCQFYKIQTQRGHGYIAYRIGKTVEVDKIHAVGINPNETQNMIESLVYELRNNAAALQLDLVIDTEDEDVIKFIENRNHLLKQQKFDPKYFWKAKQKIKRG